MLNEKVTILLFLYVNLLTYRKKKETIMLTRKECQNENLWLTSGILATWEAGIG
jgi:hypothetical protein